ncbi:internal virion protein A [Yersinia pestis]|uniref:Gp13 n=4 Tax=unclassified Berlinvirus TaxID=2745901 RepID=B3VCL1_9CAUD|nr:internal virion protein A [Yersinia pestis]YP_002003347.1 internal virion protein [Yersinia phage Yepe2]YP_009014855.1 internal virion protein [Yersinia phage Yep-phi]AFK13476.1 protein inside capsid A [Yersinia phage YpP-G]QTI27942.1 scaffold protein [Yersinia phage vB_YpP-YepMm]ACF15716.1 gp13 [Yersinia phage Yepe2]ADQ83188.1 internal virion protein A [Yersinia phage Yep-phi]MBD3443826.1 internal virion protein A [Yersinia pestis]
MIILPTTERDFMLFKPSEEDIAEAKAYGIEPSFPPASECVTMSLHGVPLAIGGNCGDQVWFVTSDEVWKLSRPAKREFRKLILEYRDTMLKQYPVIWNYVWIGNKSHIRFLKSIGAVFHNEFTGDSNQFQLFTIGG